MPNYKGVSTDEPQVASIRVGGGAPLNKLQIVSASLTPAEVAATAAIEQTFTVAGVKAGDLVAVTAPGTTAGIGIGAARATADNTVGIHFSNPTAGALTPPAGSYVFLVAR